MAPPRVSLQAASLAALCLVSSSLAGASGVPADPSARVRAWITAARFGAADSAATAWLDVVEAARPADSLAIAAALDLRVEARALGSLGDLAETQGAAERALRLKEARLPAGDPALATSLANLGEVLRARGRYPEAHERFAQALRIRERSEG